LLEDGGEYHGLNPVVLRVGYAWVGSGG
jgi:hypothetical protein